VDRVHGAVDRRRAHFHDGALHCHILVVDQLHPGDILLHPIGLELILLPVGQEVVDGILQPNLVATDPRCDGMPGSIGNNIVVRGPKMKDRRRRPEGGGG
jgi:hypothetical protein